MDTAYSVHVPKLHAELKCLWRNEVKTLEGLVDRINNFDYRTLQDQDITARKLAVLCLFMTIKKIVSMVSDEYLSLDTEDKPKLVLRSPLIQRGNLVHLAIDCGGFAVLTHHQNAQANFKAKKTMVDSRILNFFSKKGSKEDILLGIDQDLIAVTLKNRDNLQFVPDPANTIIFASIYRLKPPLGKNPRISFVEYSAPIVQQSFTDGASSNKKKVVLIASRNKSSSVNDKRTKQEHLDRKSSCSSGESSYEEIKRVNRINSKDENEEEIGAVSTQPSKTASQYIAPVVHKSPSFKLRKPSNFKNTSFSKSPSPVIEPEGLHQIFSSVKKTYTQLSTAGPGSPAKSGSVLRQRPSDQSENVNNSPSRATLTSFKAAPRDRVTNVKESLRAMVSKQTELTKAHQISILEQVVLQNNSTTKQALVSSKNEVYPSLAPLQRTPSIGVSSIEKTRGSADTINFSDGRDKLSTPGQPAKKSMFLFKNTKSSSKQGSIHGQ